MHPSVASMDESIQRMLLTLSQSNPQAMAEMKKVFWQGTDHWDQLLAERAAISGKLVLSDFTRKAIAAFRKK
jgi:methylglutaconyl-CoA hydratase